MTPQRPEESPLWLAYFYSCVVASTVLGLGCVMASTFYHPAVFFAPTFFVAPAVFGGLHAHHLLRYHFWARRFLKENGRMPLTINIDPESGFAMVTRLDGELVSLHIPDAISEAGPQAVMDYVVESLEAD